nr:hypothetical protein 29 [bacterium]
MDSLSGNQVKDLKDLYKSIYKVEESTEETVGTPSSVEEETITEMPTLPKMGTLFPSEIKKDSNKINFSTNIAGTPINKNQIDKNKNKKMSNIPPAEGSNKKFNPDFGKKPEVNKVDTNKVDTNKNDIVKKGPDLNAISKYTDSNRKEVTMKDFQSSDSGVKPVKSKMNPIEVKNRARFGDDRVDMLKAKNIDFKAMRKGDMTKDDFIKKYPKSITAQKAAGLRDEYEPYDLLLDYVLSEGHAETVEEAHYVMTQMDTDTIQTILEFLGGRPGDGYLGHPNLDIKNPFFKGKRTKGPVLNKSNADKLPDVNVNKVGAQMGDYGIKMKKLIDEM